MPRPRGTGRSLLVVLSLPWGTCRGTLAGREASPRGVAAELSAGMQPGKKDLAGALMVGGLTQTQVLQTCSTG